MAEKSEHFSERDCFLALTVILLAVSSSNVTLVELQETMQEGGQPEQWRLEEAIRNLSVGANLLKEIQADFKKRVQGSDAED